MSTPHPEVFDIRDARVRISALERELTEAHAANKHLADDWAAAQSELSALKADLTVERADNARLREELASVGSSYATMVSILKADLARARDDEARYRWLRDRYTVSLLSGKFGFRITYDFQADSVAGIDAAIDAARGRK